MEGGWGGIEIFPNTGYLPEVPHLAQWWEKFQLRNHSAYPTLSARRGAINAGINACNPNLCHSPNQRATTATKLQIETGAQQEGQWDEDTYLQITGSTRNSILLDTMGST